MKILSFCTGCGGLDIGLQEAHVGEVALYCEKDPVIRQTLKRHWPDIPIAEDLLALDKESVLRMAGLTPADVREGLVSVGGIPCPSFSTMGKRRAFDDPRGACMMHFLRLSVDLHAQYIVLENVRGLLSAAIQHRPLKARGKGHPPLAEGEKRGTVLLHMVAFLEEAGYAVSYHLYNALCFGAPQSRERVVLFAVRTGPPVPLLVPTHGEGLRKHRTLGDAIADLEMPDLGDWVQFPKKRLPYFQLLKAGENWRNLPEGMRRTAMGEGTYKAGGGKTGVFRRLSYEKPCPTLTCSPVMHTTALCHPKLLRPLSVREYKRVQGFPDDFHVCGNISKQYKQLGNAVPVPLAVAIGRAIVQHARGVTPEVPRGYKFSRYKCMPYSKKRQKL